MDGLKNTSAIGRLLAEMSWEGNAKKYHQGGRGFENVLTTEVFNALDWLPRPDFLGQVIEAAHGADAARSILRAQAERCSITVLPGDLHTKLANGQLSQWTVQPDVLVESSEVYCLVEAKRIRKTAQFGQKQMARSLATCLHQAGKRTPLLLLVLGEDPPLNVKLAERQTITEAVECGMALFKQPTAFSNLAQTTETVAWITWHEIQEVIRANIQNFDSTDPAVRASIQRITSAATRAIDWHS